MVEYDAPLVGQTKLRELQEQIQEDILAIMDVDGLDTKGRLTTQLCQIVVDRFEELKN